jgi:hypothetical protein
MVVHCRRTVVVLVGFAEAAKYVMEMDSYLEEDSHPEVEVEAEQNQPLP